MLIRQRPAVRLATAGIVLCAAFMPFPGSAAHAAAPAMAVYRGDVSATPGPVRRIELRLKADGTMSWISDYHNNRAAVTEDGHWNPVSLEQIDIIIERKDGVAVAPVTLHFVKQGDVLQAAAESAGQFGSRGLQLRQTKTAAAPVAVSPLSAAGTVTGSWRWESLVSQAGRIEVDRPERYTLELQRGGKAAVRADCNRGQAAYRFDGRSAAIKLTAMTKTACPPGSRSEQFVKSLEAAVGQRIKGERLFLDLPAEEGTMTFVRAR
jgi:heat shock protein HslJ